MYPYNPRRTSPRLKDYDYSQNGAYFVTICTHGHLCLFGEVIEGEMRLNVAGEMLIQWWEELLNKFPGIELDAYIVMPNHVHGILLIMQQDSDAPLSQMIQWFKTMTTNAYIRGVREHDWQPFERKLWQRSFHDHIIRHGTSYDTVRQYVLFNPLKWAQDILHPGHPQRRELWSRADKRKARTDRENRTDQ